MGAEKQRYPQSPRGRWRKQKLRYPLGLCGEGQDRDPPQAGVSSTDGESRRGGAYHPDEISAAVLAHQFLFAVASLDDAAQPPIQHDVGAV
ncbi:hypothetical protein MC885_017489 [Smutsia gigantea]|nr:hypothetical protein MC885_017489 [Smutsia gigantea]